jgi:Derlin-2/3
VLITGGERFASVLALAFIYTSSQDDRGQKTTFFVVTIPIQWLPYAILLVTLVSGGPTAAMIQATGLIAAHLHDFLTRLWPIFGGGRNLLPTPAFVKRMFTTRPVIKKVYGEAHFPAQRASSELAPDPSWGWRGSGHKLGGAGSRA